MSARLVVRKQRWSGLWLVLDRSTGSLERTEDFLHSTWQSAINYATKGTR